MLEVLYHDSLKGLVKEFNQDAYLIKPFENGDFLLAVADGMGGGVMGDILAKRAIEILDNIFDREVDYPLQRLKQALFIINDELNVMLSGQKGGTTLSVVYYSSSEIFYINIGDSRVWLFRDEEIVNLTVDQNIYEFKKLNNIYTDEEDRRFIYKILGISTNFDIEEILESKIWSAIGSFELKKDDILFLSTDGFHDYMEEKSLIKSLFWRGSIFQEIEKISHDNITAIVAKETE
jgi:protein phosphatase